MVLLFKESAKFVFKSYIRNQHPPNPLRFCEKNYLIPTAVLFTLPCTGPAPYFKIQHRDLQCR